MAERADNKCEDCGRATWAAGLVFEDMLLCPVCMDMSAEEDVVGELMVEFSAEGGLSG